MTKFMSSVILGLGTGSMYSLIALGFIAINKSTQVLNFAQGQFTMLASYFGVVILIQLHPIIPIPIWLGLPLVLALSATMGYVTERFFMRPMIGQPLFASVMITIMLFPCITGLVGAIWGIRTFRYPRFIPELGLTLAGIRVSGEALWSFISASLILIGLASFYKFTRLGLAMRLTSEDSEGAAACGISVRRVGSMSWCVSGLIAGLGGIILGHLQGTSLHLGLLGMIALPAVLIGGLESFVGAFIASLLIGVTGSLSVFYLDPVFGGGCGDVLAYLVMILIVLIRPYGLFGYKRIERV